MADSGHSCIGCSSHPHSLCRHLLYPPKKEQVQSTKPTTTDRRRRPSRREDRRSRIHPQSAHNHTCRRGGRSDRLCYEDEWLRIHTETEYGRGKRERRVCGDGESGEM
ncbi:hypothetical protein BLNAU_16566 [Blattamonas nauphoetae]|uniref:Uncharacterized protein n=1 Tax=Blattamonas nauphoetae TaxID=2049346 RepID=A0ABQ9XB48_9EUKA|nr:hypothetical protein BLNAU_16566 [Blattamonas nauphoetae]